MSQSAGEDHAELMERQYEESEEGSDEWLRSDECLSEWMADPRNKAVLFKKLGIAWMVP